MRSKIMFKNSFIIKQNVVSFSNLTDKMSDIYPTLKVKENDAVVRTSKNN